MDAHSSLASPNFLSPGLSRMSAASYVSGSFRRRQSVERIRPQITPLLPTRDDKKGEPLLYEPASVVSSRASSFISKEDVHAPIPQGCSATQAVLNGKKLLLFPQPNAILFCLEKKRLMCTWIIFGKHKILTHCLRCGIHKAFLPLHHPVYVLFEIKKKLEGEECESVSNNLLDCINGYFQ